jgi:hypothetical protein
MIALFYCHRFCSVCIARRNEADQCRLLPTIIHYFRLLLPIILDSNYDKAINLVIKLAIYISGSSCKVVVILTDFNKM